MMLLSEIQKLLETTGMPVAYLSFDEEDAPDMPFISWQAPYSNNFGADGKVYYPVTHIQIDLYSKYKDESAEQKLEDALADFFYNKTSEKDSKESFFRTTYELEV